MKYRNEDEIAKLAFGDFTAAEAASARKSVDSDPEASALFAEYASLAGDLRRLPVPEHQLSTERLRDAILNQNLKPRPAAASIWKWLWTPVAVGACAYLLTFAMRNSPSQGPTAFIDGGGSLEPGDDLAQNLKLPEPSVAAEPESFAKAIEQDSQPTPNGVSGPGKQASTPIGRPSPKMGAETRGALALASGSKNSAPALLAKEPPPGAFIVPEIENAVAMNALAVDAEPADAAPLLIIGSDTDSATGANRATEVHSVSNVVVGG